MLGSSEMMAEIENLYYDWICTAMLIIGLFVDNQYWPFDNRHQPISDVLK